MDKEEYLVFDGDECIFKGTSKEIKEKMNIRERISIYTYAMRGFKYKSRYIFKFVKEKDDDLEWISNNLINRNNAAIRCTDEEKKEIIEKLKNRGIFASARLSIYSKKGKQKDWVLELEDVRKYN